MPVVVIIVILNYVRPHKRIMEYIIGLIEQQKYSGNYDRAIFLSESALKQNPNNIELLYISALLYADIGFYTSSISFYERILEIDGNNKDALFDLAAVLFRVGEWKKAMFISDKLIQIDPHYKRISMHTANALCLMGKWEDAMTRYKIDISNKKEDVSAWSDMLLSMNYVDMGREDRFSHYLELYHSLPNPQPMFDLPTEKINVGYVSSDFRNHAVAYFTKGVLPHHNREKFNPFFYHNSFVEDDITELFKLGGTYKKVANLSDDKLIEQIIKDNIHILVDLNGHTRGNRLGVFARKPAPIQISWLGFLNTIGVPAIEHKIVHPQMISDGNYYTEKIHKVDGTLFYSPPKGCPDVSVEPFIVNGVITYGCFNNPRKIGDRTLSVWDQILTQTGNSKLKLLSTGDEEFDELTRKKFSSDNRDRIEFCSERGTLEFMKLISSVDVCLDPFPHSGGATTAHSLWMGVPVVTMGGETEFQNISSSILKDLRLNDFICKNENDYVYCVTSIEKERLSKLRSTLRDMFPKSPKKSVLNLETLYLELVSPSFSMT